MFSLEQKRRTIETFVRYGRGYADTAAEPGYLRRATLRLRRNGRRWRAGGGALGEGCRRRSKDTDDQGARRSVGAAVAANSPVVSATAHECVAASVEL